MGAVALLTGLAIALAGRAVDSSMAISNIDARLDLSAALNPIL
jgi:hypothetical protein